MISEIRNPELGKSECLQPYRFLTSRNLKIGSYNWASIWGCTLIGIMSKRWRYQHLVWSANYRCDTLKCLLIKNPTLEQQLVEILVESVRECEHLWSAVFEFGLIRCSLWQNDRGFWWSFIWINLNSLFDKPLCEGTHAVVCALIKCLWLKLENVYENTMESLEARLWMTWILLYRFCLGSLIRCAPWLSKNLGHEEGLGPRRKWKKEMSWGHKLESKLIDRERGGGKRSMRNQKCFLISMRLNGRGLICYFLHWGYHLLTDISLQHNG